jgi:uncharacterized membrane protein YbaN (DUF454 family)
VTAMMMLAIAVFSLQQKQSWYCLAIHLNIIKLYYLYSMETLFCLSNLSHSFQNKLLVHQWISSFVESPHQEEKCIAKQYQLCFCCKENTAIANIIIAVTNH